MSSDIVTLQMKLMQAQRSQNNPNCGNGGSNNDQPISFYRMHTAAVERANYLLESGQFSDREVAYFAKLPLSVIESEKARIAERDVSRRRYHRTGDLPASFLPQAQKVCNFWVPFVYVICQANVIKQSVFECSNPSLSDYISSRGIKNPEANVRYAFENQQRVTGNATDLLHDKSILFK